MKDMYIETKKSRDSIGGYINAMFQESRECVGEAKDLHEFVLLIAEYLCTKDVDFAKEMAKFFDDKLVELGEV